MRMEFPQENFRKNLILPHTLASSERRLKKLNYKFSVEFCRSTTHAGMLTYIMPSALLAAGGEGHLNQHTQGGGAQEHWLSATHPPLLPVYIQPVAHSHLCLCWRRSS